MYTNPQATDIMEKIQDYDIFNSKHILVLDQLNFKTRKIVNFDERLDLLTRKYYGDHQHYGVLGIINRVIDPSELQLGVKLKVPTRDQLSNLNSEEDL